MMNGLPTRPRPMGYLGALTPEKEAKRAAKAQAEADALAAQTAAKAAKQAARQQAAIEENQDPVAAMLGFSIPKRIGGIPFWMLAAGGLITVMYVFGGGKKR